MSFDPSQIVTIMAVVVGSGLGYLSTYLNNRQQRRLQLESEFRTWKRNQLTNDIKNVVRLSRKFTELAHLYIEHCEDPNNKLTKDLLKNKQEDVILYLREELTEFPFSLKIPPTEQLLEELDRATDQVSKIALSGNSEKKLEEMRSCFDSLLSIEQRLEMEYHKMIKATFSESLERRR